MICANILWGAYAPGARSTVVQRVLRPAARGGLGKFSARGGQLGGAIRLIGGPVGGAMQNGGFLPFFVARSGDVAWSVVAWRGKAVQDQRAKVARRLIPNQTTAAHHDVARATSGPDRRAGRGGATPLAAHAPGHLPRREDATGRQPTLPTCQLSSLARVLNLADANGVGGTGGARRRDPNASRRQGVEVGSGQGAETACVSGGERKPQTMATGLHGVN